MIHHPALVPTETASSPKTTEVPLDRIEVGAGRARELDNGHAQALADSISMQGLLYPVLVRPAAGDRCLLVDGLHRLRAFELLARADIPVMMSDKLSDDEAMLDQVMANLARRMAALDFCRHLYMLKAAWLRLHPEAKPGGNKNVIKGKARSQNLASGDRRSDDTRSQILASGSDGAEIIAFDGAMADKFGLGRSTVKEAVAIWTKLSSASRKALHGTRLAEKKTELKALSEEKHPRQAKILDLILGAQHPGITSIADALAFLESGRAVSPIEKQFLAVNAAFGKLSEPAIDMVMANHADMALASLKRLGRI